MWDVTMVLYSTPVCERHVDRGGRGRECACKRGFRRRREGATWRETPDFHLVCAVQRASSTSVLTRRKTRKKEPSSPYRCISLQIFTLGVKVLIRSQRLICSRVFQTGVLPPFFLAKYVPVLTVPIHTPAGLLLFPYLAVLLPQNTARDIRDAEVRIKQLTNEKALREGNFRKRFKEEAEIGLQVRDWVARNGDKLRGPVVGPIGIEVRKQCSCLRCISLFCWRTGAGVAQADPLRARAPRVLFFPGERQHLREVLSGVDEVVPLPPH